MKTALSRKMKRGTAVLLGEKGHYYAPYRIQGSNVTLEETKPLDTKTLQGISCRLPGISACFQPRTIYSDIGDFSSVSAEATAAHIRSSLDRIGLFKEDYRISFVKMEDIDEHRARYSYLAVAVSDLRIIECADEENAIVRVLCPVEASLATAFAAFTEDTTLIIAQDGHFIRMVAAKKGIIYYLITINAAQSFDAVADTVSGIREITTLLANTHREKIQAVYLVGSGDITEEDLLRHSIETARPPEGLGDEAGMVHAALYGTALMPRYTFTTEKLKSTGKIVHLAQLSSFASLLMLLAGGVLTFMGIVSAGKAREAALVYQNASINASRELHAIEEAYVEVSKDLDLSNINALTETYRDFETQPRLHTVVNDISRIVPDGVFLTKIELARSQSSTAQAAPRVDPSVAPPPKSTTAKTFTCAVEGVINAPYPASKHVFSSFLSAMNGLYHVSSAAFTHVENTGVFRMECEITL